MWAETQRFCGVSNYFKRTGQVTAFDQVILCRQSLILSWYTSSLLSSSIVIHRHLDHIVLVRMARTKQSALKSTGAPAKRVKLILPNQPKKKTIPIITSSPQVEENDVVSITFMKFFSFVINNKIVVLWLWQRG
jgi:hypothetical protein